MFDHLVKQCQVYIQRIVQVIKIFVLIVLPTLLIHYDIGANGSLGQPGLFDQL